MERPMRTQYILNPCLVLSSLTDEQIFHDISNNAIYAFYYHSRTIVHCLFFFLELHVDGCANYSILGLIPAQLGMPWRNIFIPFATCFLHA
jgi:hypothetical protein